MAISMLNKKTRKYSRLIIAVLLVFCVTTDGYAATVKSTLSIKDTNNTSEISIVMVGDVLPHERVESASLNDDGTYDYSAIFSEISDVTRAADIAILNQESIIGGVGLGITGFPRFNASFELADAIADAGFDVICQANNHALDKGTKGIKNCLANWGRFDNIIVAGLHKSQKDQNAIRYIKIDGVKIAILNYTYGTNGISMPSSMPYAVDLLKKKRVVADLKKAKKNADYIIVCPHWGKEYSTSITKSQKSWTTIFLENGADLVIGTHPHVIQPIKKLTSSKGHKMVVYYSLGNFVSWTNSSGNGVRSRVLGGMAEIKLKVKKKKVSISHYTVRALVTHLEDKKNGVIVYPLSKYSDELAEKNEILKQDAYFSKEDCINRCNSIWSKWH